MKSHRKVSGTSGVVLALCLLVLFAFGCKTSPKAESNAPPKGVDPQYAMQVGDTYAKLRERCGDPLRSSVFENSWGRTEILHYEELVPTKRKKKGQREIPFDCVAEFVITNDKVRSITRY